MPTPSDLEAGQTITYSRTFTREDVETFAELSGDRGYHHLVEEGSGPAMVHGLLTATLPTKVGGDINYVARTMHFEFPRPVYTGETITCEVTLETLSESNGRRELEASWVCTNEDEAVVLRGSSEGILYE
ncbi:MAG: MaoC family dehydratase [Halodesulfurarchaeum sp.]